MKLLLLSLLALAYSCIVVQTDNAIIKQSSIEKPSFQEAYEEETSSYDYDCTLESSSSKKKLDLNEENDCKTRLKLLGDPNSYFIPGNLQDVFDKHLSFDKYISYSMESVQHITGGYDDDVQRYDSKEDLLNSYYRSVARSKITDSNHRILLDEEDEKLQVDCGRQLDIILKEVRKLLTNATTFGDSKQLSLLNFLDSFGTISPQWMKGHTMWMGSYEQCIKSTLRLQDESETKTRYCIANYRSSNWFYKSSSVYDRQSAHAIKLGICLPKSCNSVSFPSIEHKLDAIIKLTRFARVPFSSYKMIKLYCIPDEDSPIRRFNNVAKTFLALLTLWIAILVFFNLKFELKRMNWLQDSKKTKYLTPSLWMNVFSLRLAVEKLFDSSGIEKQEVSDSDCRKSKQSNDSTNENPDQQVPLINLTIIDGCKVISMIWIICAHATLIFMRRIANSRDTWEFARDLRFITILSGIFPIETFFVATGIVLSYFSFKKDDGKAMCKPSFWIGMFIYRYLRFLPMYLVGFVFSRDVMEHLGAGPMWDYGTGDTTPLGLCKQESIIEPFLFRANFKSIEQHCVRPAWYLANDLHYLMLSPIFLIPLVKSTSLGRLVIAVTIGISLVLQITTFVCTSSIQDAESIVSIKPTFLTTFFKTNWRLYGLPHNRIVPYLVGLLTGHLLYRRVKDLDSKTSNETDMRGSSDSTNRPSFLINLKSYICLQLWYPLFVIFSIVHLPLAARIVVIEGDAAILAAANMIPLTRLAWSIAVSRVIYICATRSVSNTSDSSLARFLSSSKWKPWSRLALSAIIIQWELIRYCGLVQTSVINMSFIFLSPILLFCVVITYALSLISYLFLEYPFAQILQLYILPALFKSNKNKQA